MSAPSGQHDAEPDEAITALVHEFFERRQAGEDLTPERFVAEYPEQAEGLRPYLEGLPLIEQACTLGISAVSGEAPPGDVSLPAIEGYELLEEIGRGGMGIVYRALQTSTKRIVAVKVMRGGPFASSSARRRFQREVELAARLRHPHIVRVLEAGHVTDRPYYAMDHVVGTELKRYLSTAQPELRATLELFAHICEAVDYAHEHGVIHRDLKPGNVLVDDEGQPHILDFGLAKAADRADQEQALTPQVSGRGLVMGTLHYLSPEQAAGAPDEIDTRSDVYALGVMLFEALTGSLPFDTRGSPSEVIDRVLESPPTPPSSLSKRVDGELEAIILKALEKDRDRRYQSAGEMVEDLRRYLAGEPILARQPSGLYVVRKKLRKHRVAVILGAAAAVLALAGLFTESSSRQRRLAQARLDALRCQRGLEGGIAERELGPAQTLYARHSRLPEAGLVWAQAQYRSEEMRDGVVMFLERSVKQSPSRWVYCALLAEIFRAAGNAERADALQAQAEREAPDTAEAWYLRSFATLELRHALRCAQEAVDRQPSYMLAWNRLSYLRLRTGDPEGAVQAADKLIELGEDRREWTLFKGRVRAQQGRYQDAIEYFSQVGVYLARAHAYRQIKEYDKAVADYNWLLERQDDTGPNLWVFYQRATPLWILGRTDEALEDYRRFRVLLGRPFFSDARRYLILRELGRRQEAEQILSAALRDVTDAWLRQIFLCLSSRLTPEELVAAARDNSEQLCEAFYYAGEVCLLADRHAEARDWFERCVQTGLAFDPDTQLTTPMNEYELAQWRLESRFAETKPTSQP